MKPHSSLLAAGAVLAAYPVTAVPSNISFGRRGALNEPRRFGLRIGFKL
jgi:hypothetical protein